MGRLSLFGFLVASLLILSECSDPVVQTPVGKVTGSTEKFEDVSLDKFLGVPYAQPPIGALRFAFPQPRGSFGDLEAKNFSAACPQTRTSHWEVPMNEDCLYLNIYRISGRKQGDNLPVSRLWCSLLALDSRHGITKLHVAFLGEYKTLYKLRRGRGSVRQSRGFNLAQARRKENMQSYCTARAGGVSQSDSTAITRWSNETC